MKVLTLLVVAVAITVKITASLSEEAIQTINEGFVAWAVISGLVLVMLATGLSLLRSTAEPSPSVGVRTAAERVAWFGPKVSDLDLRKLIEEIKKDVHRHSYSYSANAAEFEYLQTLLVEAKSVLDTYIHIQDNPQDYQKPEQALAEGAQAIRDLHVIVRDMLVKASTEKLPSYRSGVIALGAAKEARILATTSSE